MNNLCKKSQDAMEIAFQTYGVDVDQCSGPDENGDWACLLNDGRPVIVYHDGTTDIAAGTWDELLNSSMARN